MFLAMCNAASSRQTVKIDGILALWEALQLLHLVEDHTFFSGRSAVLWHLWLLTSRSYWRKLAHSPKSLPVPLGELIRPKILSPEHGGPNLALATAEGARLLEEVWMTVTLLREPVFLHCTLSVRTGSLADSIHSYSFKGNSLSWEMEC